MLIGINFSGYLFVEICCLCLLIELNVDVNEKDMVDKVLFC